MEFNPDDVLRPAKPITDVWTEEEIANARARATEAKWAAFAPAYDPKDARIRALETEVQRLRSVLSALDEAQTTQQEKVAEKYKPEIEKVAVVSVVCKCEHSPCEHDHLRGLLNEDVKKIVQQELFVTPGQNQVNIDIVGSDEFTKISKKPTTGSRDPIAEKLYHPNLSARQVQEILTTRAAQRGELIEAPRAPEYSKTYTSFSGADVLTYINGEAKGFVDSFYFEQHDDGVYYGYLREAMFDRSGLIPLPKSAEMKIEFANEYGGRYEMLFKNVDFTGHNMAGGMDDVVMYRTFFFRAQNMEEARVITTIKTKCECGDNCSC